MFFRTSKTFILFKTKLLMGVLNFLKGLVNYDVVMNDGCYFSYFDQTFFLIIKDECNSFNN